MHGYDCTINRADACLRTGEVQRREPRHRREPQRCHSRRAELVICNDTSARSGLLSLRLARSRIARFRFPAPSMRTQARTAQVQRRQAQLRDRAEQQPERRGPRRSQGARCTHARCTPSAELRAFGNGLCTAMKCPYTYRPLRASSRAPQLVGSPRANSPAQPNHQAPARL
jgi:hypothetical protein